MGRHPGWMVTLTGRPAMRRRVDPRSDAMWSGFLVEDRRRLDQRGCDDSDVSGPVGSRWLCERGGMPSIALTPQRAGICHLPNATRLHSSKPRTWRLERSRAGGTITGRSRENCIATPQPAVASWTTGNDSPVEGRADGAASEGVEADVQRTAPGLWARPPRGDDRPPGRRAGAGTSGAVHRSAPRAPD